MDLRKRLAGRLAGFSAALLLVAGAVLLENLRSDVQDEMRASSRLADLLLAASNQRCSIPDDQAIARIAGIIGQGELRHVSVRLRPAQAAPDPSAHVNGWPEWLGRLTGLPASIGRDRLVNFGEHTLVISPDPRSEVREIVRDAVRLLAALVLFSLAVVVAVWYAAHQALVPVREIVAGLARLEQGDRDARLPQLELKEYAQVAGAIDRLANSLDAARSRQQHLTRQLISLQEVERRELSRELHDELGQNLAAIAVTAAHVKRHAGTAKAEELAKCGQEIERDVLRIASHVRTLLARLRPHGLDGPGLLHALRELLVAWEQRAATMRFVGRLPDHLPDMGEAAALALYRILQEALTNVVHHAQARCATVSLRLDQALTIEVADDGLGFRSGRAGGLGLHSMRERATELGGTFSIESLAAGGMVVRATLPVEEG